MDRTTSSRERMIDAAELVMRERGLALAGIKEVAARGQAPIGSLYHHFPDGKKQLATLALERRAEKTARLLAGEMDVDRPVAERVRALFAKAAQVFDQSDRLKSCAIGTVTLDLGPDDGALRAVCAGAFRRWAGEIAERLPWTDAAARRSYAEAIVVAIEGAFVLARAHQSGEPFVAAGEWLARAAITVETGLP